MAVDAGELVVKISADIAEMKAAIQVATQQVGELGAGTVATGTLMADAFLKVGQEILNFSKNSVMAFGESEQTLIRLTNLVGTDATQGFREYADEVERTTAFSHDQVLAMDSQLAAFGIMPDQIQKASGALIDYAAQTGKTLPEAANVLGRAMAGNSRELKALGVEIFSTDDRTTKFNKTVDTLNEKFGGVAKQLSGTTLGSIESFKNAFTDMEESMGRFLASPAIGMTKWLTDVVKNVTSSLDVITKFTAEVGGMGKMFESVFLEIGRNVINFLATYLNYLVALGPVLKLVGINIDDIKNKLNAKIDTVQKDIQKTKESENATVKAEKNKVVVISDTQRALDQYISSLEHSIMVEQVVQSDITQITELELKKRMLAVGNSFEANASFSDQFRLKETENLSKIKSDFVSMADKMIDSFSQATAKMILDGGRFRDVMKQIWQQIAQEVIAQIIRMIVQMMVLNAMTGGTGGAAGHFLGFGAEGGMINEPSILTGMRTGNTMVVGEAGPESFGPAGGVQGNTLNAPGGGGGGSAGGSPSITVNISGQFLEGSQSKWQEMVRSTIIPAIKRWAMSNPTGPFNRVRGTTT